MAVKRPMFICSAITVCQQTANCCPHRIPHIKDERCIPKACRFAPAESNPVDCVPYDPQALLEAAKAKESAPLHPDERNPLQGTTGDDTDAD